MSKDWENIHCGPCCNSMRSALHEHNSPAQGFHEVERTDPNTGVKRRIGIAMRMPSDTTVLIRFCCFCGAQHEATA